MSSISALTVSSNFEARIYYNLVDDANLPRPSASRAAVGRRSGHIGAVGARILLQEWGLAVIGEAQAKSISFSAREMLYSDHRNNRNSYSV